MAGCRQQYNSQNTDEKRETAFPLSHIESSLMGGALSLSTTHFEDGEINQV
jgi:hypothetical protein